MGEKLSAYDLMRLPKQKLVQLYNAELERVGATSLDSIIAELSRREMSGLTKLMTVLTVIMLILTVVSTAAAVWPLVRTGP